MRQVQKDLVLGSTQKAVAVIKKLLPGVSPKEVLQSVRSGNMLEAPTGEVFCMRSDEQMVVV